MKRCLLFISLLSLTVWACTPKVAEETTKTEEEKPKTETPKPKPQEGISPCPNWNDAPNKEQLTTDYVLCRDEIKKENYDAAYTLWKRVYDVAPAADGRRNTIYTWGLAIYNDKYKKATDPTEKKAHVDFIMKLYDEMNECYPKDKGFIYGRKAFDLYYNYPDMATQQEKYDLFKKSLDTDGVKSQAFVLNPFTDLLIRQYNDKAISIEEARKYDQLIKDVLANGLAKSKGQTLENFQIVESYAPMRLEEFEAEKGFYDCDYYKNKYLANYEENRSDCDVLIDVYSTLRWGGCSEADAKLQEINNAYGSSCREDEPAPDPKDPRPTTGPSCKDLLRAGQYVEAVKCMEERYNKTSNTEYKAKYAYSMASIYYGKLKKFSTARNWANKAAENKPGWGKPYKLIGDMYASSGPLCGPGRGWESQVVVWVAMDMWYKAKKDPSVAAAAQKSINKYSQYLPEKQDGFMRGVKEGDSYKVPCWIQRTTKVRFKK